MPRVKVCGFTHEDDVQAAVSAGVDAVGAIVDVPVETPREVTPDTAAELFETVPPFVSTVLVTMPDSLDRARGLIERVRPDVVQIHDGLSVTEIRDLGGPGLGTIVSVAHDDPAIDRYATAADALLVDSTDETGAGGTGRTHDWNATSELRALGVPLILAGGLTPANVSAAVETVDPFAVDVASGVETEPGRKDPTKLRRFVEAATAGAGAL